MTGLEAIYRELMYGTTLNGLMASGTFRLEHVKQDLRLEPDTVQDDEEYPWLIFRRVSLDRDDGTGVVQEVIEFETIFKNSSVDRGEALGEAINEAVIATFAGKRKTWGKFTAAGLADPSGGKLMSVSHQDTTESFDSELDEKIKLSTFRFAYSE